MSTAQPIRGREQGSRTGQDTGHRKTSPQRGTSDAPHIHGRAVLTDRYSPGDRQWLAKKRTSQLWIARADWRATLDMIVWEHETFHNDIPFSGDARPVRPGGENR